MCLQPSPFPLAHPLATQVVCLLAQYLVQLLDAVTGWIGSNDMIAASYEPVSILWDVLGALEAMVRGCLRCWCILFVLMPADHVLSFWCSLWCFLFFLSLFDVLFFVLFLMFSFFCSLSRY